MLKKYIIYYTIAVKTVIKFIFRDIETVGQIIYAKRIYNLATVSLIKMRLKQLGWVSLTCYNIVHYVS